MTQRKHCLKQQMLSLARHPGYLEQNSAVKPLNHLENTSLKNDSVFVVEDHSFRKDNNDLTHAEIK